jgi:hypothetical protein
MTTAIFTLLSAVLCGGLWGAREAYHADPSVFKSRPQGFFGADAWKWRYKNGDPEQGLLHWVFRYVGVPDFWHLSGELHWALLGVAVLIAAGNWWLISGVVIVRLLVANLSYRIARR